MGEISNIDALINDAENCWFQPVGVPTGWSKPDPVRRHMSGLLDAARTELAALRKRLSLLEAVATAYAGVDHSVVCDAGQYGVVEPCTCDLAPLAKAVAAVRALDAEPKEAT